jgi:hypothetical protein
VKVTLALKANSYDEVRWSPGFHCRQASRSGRYNSSASNLPIKPTPTVATLNASDLRFTLLMPL